MFAVLPPIVTATVPGTVNGSRSPRIVGACTTFGAASGVNCAGDLHRRIRRIPLQAREVRAQRRVLIAHANRQARTAEVQEERGRLERDQVGGPACSRTGAAAPSFTGLPL